MAFQGIGFRLEELATVGVCLGPEKLDSGETCYWFRSFETCFESAENTVALFGCLGPDLTSWQCEFWNRTGNLAQ